MTVVTRTLLALALSAATIASIGCQELIKGKDHQRYVNEADRRWKETRSALMLNMAQQQFKNGDLAQATNSLADAIAIDQSNPQLYVMAGRVALERDMVERSLIYLNKALQVDAGTHKAHYYLGLVFQRWEQFDKALSHYTKAYDIVPDHAPYLLAWGEMLVALNRVDEALSLFEKKSKYFEASAGLHIAMAQLYMMREQHDKAVLELRQAALMQPEDAQIREQLATALIATGQHDAALREYRWLDDEGYVASRRDLQTTVASTYLAGGNVDEARRRYQALARLAPNDAEVWLGMAQANWAANNLTGTLGAAQHIIQIAPSRHEPYLLIGLVMHRRGLIHKALKMYGKAAQAAADEHKSQSLIMRGLALEHVGKSDAAIESYRAALRFEPGNERARQLLDRLAANVN